MSGMEMLAVVTFLLIGYWIVSAIFDWLKKPRESDSDQEQPPRGP